MSKEDWDKEKEILKGSAEQIFTVSVLLGEVVIWLLVSLLVYSEFILGESFSKNAVKMIVVGAIIAILIWLGVFLILKARKRLQERNEEDGENGNRN